MILSVSASHRMDAMENDAILCMDQREPDFLVKPPESRTKLELLCH